MTDVLNREEVMETTVLQALTLPANEWVTDNIQRFGFEYEMLPCEKRDSYDSDSDSDSDDCCCEYDYDEFDEQGERTYTCTSCRERYNARDAGPGGSGDLIDRFYQAGLLNHRQQHNYHCDCDDCCYGRQRPLMCAQTDCTVAVEFVSRICDLSGDLPVTEINALIGVMQRWNDDGHWMPNGDYSCGNHVHVSHQGDMDRWGGNYHLGDRAHSHINALYAVFDWNHVADGGCGRVRGYNSKPSRGHAYGNYLSWRDNTAEHRLWNTPRDPQRLWAHIGLSIALTRWGFAVAAHDRRFTFWKNGGSMDDHNYNVIASNVDEVVRGIRAYVPTNPEFDIARDLIANLRPMAY